MSKRAFDRIAAGLHDAIAHARGEETGAVVHTFTPAEEIDVASVRAKTELSQDDFAATFGLKVGTLRHWEQKLRRPVGAARVLLTLIDRDPVSVLTTLRGSVSKRPARAPRARASRAASASRR
jgi:putative transcriptional regulator